MIMMGDGERKPHFIVLRKLLAILHNASQNLKIPRHAHLMVFVWAAHEEGCINSLWGLPIGSRPVMNCPS